jgi:hypothetical protein
MALALSQEARHSPLPPPCGLVIQCSGSLADMANRAYDGRDSIAAVQERVLPAGAKGDRARQYKQQAIAALGQERFNAVFSYLKVKRRTCGSGTGWGRPVHVSGSWFVKAEQA